MGEEASALRELVQEQQNRIKELEVEGARLQDGIVAGERERIKMERETVNLERELSELRGRVEDLENSAP